MFAKSTAKHNIRLRSNKQVEQHVPTCLVLHSDPLFLLRVGLCSWSSSLVEQRSIAIGTQNQTVRAVTLHALQLKRPERYCTTSMWPVTRLYGPHRLVVNRKRVAQQRPRVLHRVACCQQRVRSRHILQATNQTQFSSVLK